MSKQPNILSDKESAVRDRGICKDQGQFPAATRFLMYSCNIKENNNGIYDTANGA